MKPRLTIAALYIARCSNYMSCAELNIEFMQHVRQKLARIACNQRTNTMVGPCHVSDTLKFLSIFDTSSQISIDVLCNAIST